MPAKEGLQKVMPPNLWAHTLVSLNKAFQLNTLVIELDGGLMFPPIYCNTFCPNVAKAVKGEKASCNETYIRAIHEIRERPGPVISRCRSGFARFLIPVRYRGLMLGCVGGCGALLENETMPEETIARLAKEFGLDSAEMLAEARISIPRLTNNVVDTYFKLLQKRVSSRVD